MIKKAKVTAIYQINMYCDDCGTRMEKDNLLLPSYPPQFQYRCPNCGHTALSQISYPVQQVQFDESTAEEISESELNIPPTITEVIENSLWRNQY